MTAKKQQTPLDLQRAIKRAILENTPTAPARGAANAAAVLEAAQAGEPITCNKAVNLGGTDYKPGDTIAPEHLKGPNLGKLAELGYYRPKSDYDRAKKHSEFSAIYQALADAQIAIDQATGQTRRAQTYVLVCEAQLQTAKENEAAAAAAEQAAVNAFFELHKKLTTTPTEGLPG